MPLPDPVVAYAAVVATLILARIYFKREDLEIGEIIYNIAVAILIAASILFVPYEIPTTGKMVFAPAWNPPEYEEIDPLKAKFFTPEIVEKMRAESTIPLPEDFFRNTVTKSARYFNLYQGLWWAVVDLACFAGWFVVPQWIEMKVNPPRRRKPRSPPDEGDLE